MVKDKKQKTKAINLNKMHKLIKKSNNKKSSRFINSSKNIIFIGEKLK
jgi:hypothetical protein